MQNTEQRKQGTDNIMEIFSEQFNSRHFLSRIDVRIKLIVIIASLAMVISGTGTQFPLIIAGLCLLACVGIKVPPRLLLLRMAEPLLIACVVLLLKLFYSGNDPLFSFSLIGLEVTGHRDGLYEGIRIVSRILGGVSLIMLLGFSTPFAELMAGLAWMKVPRSFIEIMMFAYRYVFVFIEDGVTIYQAQKNRLGYAGIRRGLKSIGTLAGSLVIRSFDQSHKTAEAMTQRGYTGAMPLLSTRPLRAGEMLIGVICIFVIGALWMIP